MAGEYASMLIKKYREDKARGAEVHSDVPVENKELANSSEENIIYELQNKLDELKKKLNIAQTHLEKLKEKAEIERKDATNILCIQIAGLCHDLGKLSLKISLLLIICMYLGHGPFSHVFDYFLDKYADSILKNCSHLKSKESKGDGCEREVGSEKFSRKKRKALVRS